MSLNVYLLLFGLLLILIDFFFRSDLPTYFAFLIFTTIIFRLIGSYNILLRIIISILFLLLLVIIHHYLWKNTILLVIDKFFSKDKYKAGVEGLVGRVGVVRIIDNKKLASINGDLYVFLNTVDLEDGETFKVKDVSDGKIII